jgi:RHS repeat-associated protein
VQKESHLWRLTGGSAFPKLIPAALVISLVASHVAAQTTTIESVHGVFFRAVTTIPYGVMDSHPDGLPIAIESERLQGVATEQLPAGFAPAHLRLRAIDGAPDPRPSPTFTLRSVLAHLPPDDRAAMRHQRGSSRFESPWMVALADPRASRHWQWPAGVDRAAAGCHQCSWPAEFLQLAQTQEIFEIWPHGGSFTVRVEVPVNGPYSYLGRQLVPRTVPTLRGDTTRIADQPWAAIASPMQGSEVVQHVALHSGELVREATDLAIRSRGIDFTLQRYYSSAIYSFGPLGRNFDSPIFARIRWRGQSALDFYDGTGRITSFTRSGNRLIPPKGIFVDGRVGADGHAIIRYHGGSSLHFDQLGRLKKITDRNVTTADERDGNVMHFIYDSIGRLATVVDPNGRAIRFTYHSPTAPIALDTYPGVLHTVTDFDGRTVRYDYDQFGRLVKVLSPDPESSRSAQQITTYLWGPPPTSGDFRLDVLRSGQITGEIDGEGRLIYNVLYSGDQPWRVDAMTTGGGTWLYGYLPEERTVSNPNGHVRRYAIDSEARVTAITEPGTATTASTGTTSLATTRFEYDSHGRLATVTRPLGDQTTFTYGTSLPNGDPRPMMNVETIIEHPSSGSPERAAGITLTTTISYGPANLPVSTTLPGGVTTSVVRDERGNPTQATDSSGVTTMLTFDEVGRLRQLSDPRSGTRSYHYFGDPERNGYIEKIVTSSGTTTFRTDQRGNVVEEVDPTGRTVEYEVNRIDQVESERRGTWYRESVWDAAGDIHRRLTLAGNDASGSPLYAQATYSHDALGRLTLVAENGRTRTYGYDPGGNLTLVTSPAEAAITYGYDARGQLVSATEGSGTTTFHYDGGGRPTGITTPRAHTKELILDGFGRTIGEVDPAGVRTLSRMDEAGRPVETRMTRERANGERYLLRWSLTEYDAAGRVTKETRKLFESPLLLPVDGGDPEGAVDVVSRWVYDDENRQQTIIDPRGAETVTEFDEMGRVRKVTDPAGSSIETEYYANGNRLSETITELDSTGAPSISRTTYEYDDQNRLIAVSDVSDPASPSVIRFVYDPRGNRTEEIDPDGRRTRYEYDLQGNRLRQIAPDGGVTRWRYDEHGRLEAMIDARGNETRYEYDDKNRLAAEIRADGARWNFGYDASGNRVRAVDANGSVITAAFDENDRLTGYDIERAVGIAGPARVILTLDELGRIVGAETSDGVKTSFTWDSLDRQTSESVQIGNGPVRTVRRSFDDADHPLTTDYPSGLRLGYMIDLAGRLRSIGDVSATIGVYDYVGTRLQARSLANGVVEQWDYDPSRRLQRIVSGLDEETLRDVEYGRLRSGRKESVVRHDLRRRWVYELNPNGWISSEAMEWLEGENGGLIRSTDYDIDPLLNYRSITETLYGSNPPAVNSTETVINVRNQYSGYGENLLRYDRNGNLTELGELRMQYDFENRLVRVTLPDGSTTEYLYDAFGRRVRERRVAPAGTRVTDYVLDGDHVIEDIVNDALVSRYVHGPRIDELLRAELGGNSGGGFLLAVFPLQDELANVERLTDSRGATLERYEYADYGRFTVFSGEEESRDSSSYSWRHLFHGRPYDPLLGTYDFRARTLWPELGRFGQEDPLKVPAGVSLYHAFLGDWVNMRDPEGLEVTWDERLLTYIDGLPAPYNFLIGTFAHSRWFDWLRRNRGDVLPAGRSFFNQTVDTILTQAGRGSSSKEKRNIDKPDVARVELNRSVTIWELKPETHDPGYLSGALPRLLIGQTQLSSYKNALRPSQIGDARDLNSSLEREFIDLVPGGTEGPYRMYAYSASKFTPFSKSSFDRTGFVFYRLERQKSERERQTERAVQRVRATTESALRSLSETKPPYVIPLPPILGPGGIPIPVMP